MAPGGRATMSARSLARPLVDFLMVQLGEQYGRIGELIRDELGIETLKQAQTSLSDRDLVEVSAASQLSSGRSLARLYDPRAHVPVLQLSKLTPGLKVAHRKVLLNAVRNASREELTITSFDGLPWRAPAAWRTLSVRVEGSEEIISMVVRRDATVAQVVSVAERATETNGELLVWDGRRQARTKLAPRHLRTLRKADPLVLVPLEPVESPPPEQCEWGAGSGWSDDDPELETRESAAGSPDDAANGDRTQAQMMDVKCPAGATAGATLMVTTSWGTIMQVIVPPGVGPGTSFEVPCFPPSPVPAPAPKPQPSANYLDQRANPTRKPQPPPHRPAPMRLSGKGTGSARPWRLAADLQESELQESELATEELQNTLSVDEHETNVEILRVTCPDSATPGDIVTVKTSWGEMLDVEVPAGISSGETFEVPSWAVLLSSGSPESAVAGSMQVVSPPRSNERKLLDEKEVARLHQVQRQKGRQDALFRAMLRNDSPPDPHPTSRTSYLAEETEQVSSRLSELATPRPRQIKQKLLEPKSTDDQAKTSSSGTGWKSPPPLGLTKLRTKPRRATLMHLETLDEWEEDKRKKIESKRQELSQLPRHRKALTKAKQKQLIRRLYDVR